MSRILVVEDDKSIREELVKLAVAVLFTTDSITERKNFAYSGRLEWKKEKCCASA